MVIIHFLPRSRLNLPFVLLSFLLLYFSNGSAQTASLKNSRKVTFAGDLRAELQYDGISGQPQNRPKNIRTIEFTPQINIPGLPPISFMLKLSSLESYLRQPFNRFALQINPPWGELNLGDSYPVLSKFTLNGILVRGGRFDAQLGLLRLAAAVGQSKRSTLQNYATWSLPNFKQYLYGLKIGIGKKEHSRLTLNLLKVLDDSTSLTIAGAKTPKENLVVGLDGFLSLSRLATEITGEIAGSGFSRDTRSRELELPQQVPTIARRIFRPRVSSQYDFAFFLQAKLSPGKTTVHATFTQIGPGFYSLGTSYLHNDIRKYSLTLSRRFFTNRLYFYGGLDQARDNLANIKTSTATSTSFFMNGSLTLKSLPAVNWGYRYYRLQNHDQRAVLAINNYLHSFQCGAFYRMKVLAITHLIGVNGTLSWYRNNSSALASQRNYDTQSLRVSDNVSFKVPVSIYASLGFMKTKFTMTGQKDDRWLYNLSLTHRAFKNRLSSSLALNYDEGKANEYYRSAYQDTTFRTQLFSVRKRTSVSLRSDYQTSSQTFSFKLERLVYRSSSFPASNYREFIVRFIFTQHFGSSLNLKSRT